MNMEQLKAGQAVRVRFSAAGDQADVALPGIVRQVYPDLQRVRVEVDMPSGKLTPCHVHPDSIVLGVVS